MTELRYTRRHQLRVDSHFKQTIGLFHQRHSGCVLVATPVFSFIKLVCAVFRLETQTLTQITNGWIDLPAQQELVSQMVRKWMMCSELIKII